MKNNINAAPVDGTDPVAFVGICGGLAQLAVAATLLDVADAHPQRQYGGCG
ncbi:hypothetical protein ACH4Y0_02375 [Streptomyces sp. NPDC020707]|uniref:hypothetical protein n=1 Tax=Streptomyces sp. NPDC020707 TaxID=3365084 RepID=UPI0037B73FB6